MKPQPGTPKDKENQHTYTSMTVVMRLGTAEPDMRNNHE